MEGKETTQRSTLRVWHFGAPTLAAEPVVVGPRKLWMIWCEHCRAHHFHRPGPGHRVAHCRAVTAYSGRGYNIARVSVDS